MWICGYEVLFWPFMGCVSDKSLQNGMLILVSNWKCFKWVSLIGKLNSTKWTWWIKLFSVNSGLEWLKSNLLRVSETSMPFCWVNIEVESHTFGGIRKISGLEGKKLFYWKLALFVIIDFDKSVTIQILMKAFNSKNYREGFLFYLYIMIFVVLYSSQ